MAGLVPAICVFVEVKTWMPGTRPGMTIFYRAFFWLLLRFNPAICSNTAQTEAVSSAA
jgi:hypothetical protein